MNIDFSLLLCYNFASRRPLRLKHPEKQGSAEMNEISKETEKLYYQNSFCREFTAEVMSCLKGKKGWDIILDRTAFYPEGGGQPADHGILGGVRVTDVHENDGAVIHTCEGPLSPGEAVTGTLDWQRRFDHMQQHSGEHIVSGLIHQMFGYDNVGFHLGADSVVIDFSGPLTEQQLSAVELASNEKIWGDEPVELLWPDEKELESMTYRSKKALSGAVRIVRFPGADVCACCGTHVLRAGQVGLIKIISAQKFREGTRLELVCGKRAYGCLSEAWGQNLQVSRSLSVKPSGTYGAVHKMGEELTSLRARLTALEDASFARRAEELRGMGDVLVIEDSPLSSDAVRRFASAVGEVCGGRGAVFAGADGEYRYAVSLKSGNLRDFSQKMNTALHGRGGGKPDFVQGSVAATRREIEQFFGSL